MTNIASDSSLLSQEETDFKSAVSEPLASKIGASINFLIDKQGESYAVGDTIHALLTEAQIQSQFDTTWILADGRDITGSDLATVTGRTTAPNALGYFIRGLDTSGVLDPDAPRTMEDSQVDAIQEHNHKLINNDDTLDTLVALSVSVPTIGTQIVRSSGSGAATQFIYGNSSFTNQLSESVGGDESRPQNISLNLFIKINN